MGADRTVRVDGAKHVDAVKEMTDGMGAEGIIDFVGEKGAIEDGIAMVKDGGFYYVIGYAENMDIPTIDVTSREIPRPCTRPPSRSAIASWTALASSSTPAWSSCRASWR